MEDIVLYLAKKHNDLTYIMAAREALISTRLRINKLSTALPHQTDDVQAIEQKHASKVCRFGGSQNAFTNERKVS